MLRTPRHDYGPTAAATPARYATPRAAANQLGSSLELPSSPHGTSAAAAASTQPAFDFLQHPLFADPESLLQGGLEFDALYSRMSDFKDKMNRMTDAGCIKADEAVENHAALKEAQAESMKQLDGEAEAEKKAQRELWTTIAAEREEDAEARRVQAEKERYVHSLSSQLSDVKGELDELRRQFAMRRDEKRRVKGKMREMARLNIPERELLESRTGCRIDSPGDDLISFTFTMLDERRPHDEAFFVFALHKRTYTMPVIQPPLPDKAVQPLLNELNRSRNAFKHIKEMRRLLKAEVQRGAKAATTLEEAMRATTTTQQ
ncbi:unnamed protein product [Parajaminaea phylloscopi]